ncbi:anthranilate synthase component I family protein, partial [Campylobacter jejuni]|nr:anthranilate synthase component I family protein [Campylobacter jejuni]
MFVKNVNFYYRQILEKFENSYFAEDLTKVIIGIDCDYLDANELSFSEFKAKYYEALSKNKICDFAGFFGVFSANFVSLFEKIPLSSKKNYDFPLFLFANAKAYLIYEKNSKMFFKFGASKYFEYLKDDIEPMKKKQKNDFEILNSLEDEKNDFLKMCEKAKEYLLSGDIF